MSGVAESLDAYYTGAGEAPGVWIGGGASRLGLDGEVAAGDLRAVLAGLRPGSGGLSPNGTPIRPTRKRIPGFDATFKVPKSASVLYAVSDDPMIQGAVIDAGEHAVREAIGWLRREAVEVRRGNHNTAQVEARRAKLIADGKDPVDEAAHAGSRRQGSSERRSTSHQPGRRPSAALARPDRQHGRGQRRALDRPRAPRPLPARQGRRRGVPSSVPCGADPHARGRVAARPTRPGDRWDPTGPAGCFLEAAGRDRSLAGSNRRPDRHGRSAGSGAGHPTGQAGTGR